MNSYLTSTSLKCRGLDGSHGREGCSSRCEDCKEVTDVDHFEDDNERLKFINESGWVCGISVDLDTIFFLLSSAFQSPYIYTYFVDS